MLKPFTFKLHIFEITGGVFGFDVLLTVLGACRALAKCSLNNWSKEEMQKMRSAQIHS